VGAKHRVMVRHRRRIAGGLAAGVIAAGIAVFFVTRTPSEPIVASPAPSVIDNNKPAAGTPTQDEPAAGDYDPRVATLVHYADTDHSRRLSAKWSRIAKPLAPYRKLLEGVTP